MSKRKHQPIRQLFSFSNRLLEQAIGSALLNVKLAGFNVLRIEIEPEVMIRGIQLSQAEQQPQNPTI